VTEIGRRQLSFEEARDIADRILVLYQAGRFDVATIIYNRFRSAMTQIVTAHQLIPFQTAASARRSRWRVRSTNSSPPRRKSSLSCCRRTWRCKSIRHCSKNAASEQGARMTAMDNATRNAGEMIDRLTLNYNRTRQRPSPRS